MDSYFRKVNGKIEDRMVWAVERTVIAKTDSGRATFNFAEWLGNGSVAAIGNTFTPGMWFRYEEALLEKRNALAIAADYDFE